MKKSNVLLASGSLLALAASLLITGCGGNKPKEKTEVEKAIENAMTLTRDELYQKAADELQDGTLKWVGTSSRAKKGVDKFKAELAKKNAKCANATIQTDVLDDGHIYAKLVQDIKAGVKTGYDGALVQDGYQLQKYGINTGYFVNYIPKEWKDDAATDKEKNAAPFSLQYNFKTWLVNNANGDVTIPDNVWDYTDKDKIINTMDPDNENVNRDWLIMLTQDKWCDDLKAAWEDPTNDKAAKDFTPDDYSSYGEKKKYAYAFIHGYLKNATFYKDDGEAVNDFSVKSSSGKYGWIVYSKMMNLQETETVSKSWIVSSALGADNVDGKTATMHMKGFSGFMYKHYLQVMPNTTHPYAVAAFINFLSTTADGYKAWGTDMGDYPSMPSINVDRTTLGHDKETGENLFPVMNDPTGEWWTSETGGNAVIEDPAYIASAYDDVNLFIINEKK